jgi:hypothetical protein
MERLVKRFLIIGLLLAAAACASRHVETTTSAGTLVGHNTVGAATARDAVEAFLGAVKAQDLQAMSVIWGTRKGPARDQMTRNDLEKREIVMQCFLAYDQSRILNDLPADDGKRTLRVELTNAGRVRQTNFTAVEGPASRWYVENAELEPVKEFCRNPGR